MCGLGDRDLHEAGLAGGLDRQDTNEIVPCAERDRQEIPREEAAPRQRMGVEAGKGNGE